MTMPLCEPTRLCVMLTPRPSLSDDELIEQITTAIEQAELPQEFLWKNITPKAGFLAARQLSYSTTLAQRDARLSYSPRKEEFRVNVIRTLLHKSHRTWFISSLYECCEEGFVTKAEEKKLDIYDGHTTVGFEKPYSYAVKDIDIGIACPKGTLPRVIVESRWSIPRSSDAATLWLLDAVPNLQVLILIEWWNLSRDTVAGQLRVFRRWTKNIQVEPIFPRPQHSEKRRIALTRVEVLGAENNRFGGLILSVDDLRVNALKAMRKMRLNPAS